MYAKVITTVAAVAKLLPTGSRCWLVNADNNRHADEVIVTGRPRRGENKNNLWVPVTSLVDGDQYETRHTNLVTDAAVRQDGVREDMERQREVLRARLVEWKAERAQRDLGFEMLRDINEAIRAKRDAAWVDALPVVTQDIGTGETRRITVTITGIDRPAYDATRGSYTIRDEHEVTVFGGKVSWASFGAVSPALAAAYARAILVATSIAAEAK